MHTHSIDAWRHDHVFLGPDHTRNERRVRIVIGLTATMMVGEIAAGFAFGSMALLADGFHMATHAGALAISGAAYAYARRHSHDPRFTFGTGKVGDLAGFSSAIVLAFVAALIAYESLQRLLAPVAIRFEEAILVAVLGLVVNLVSALLLREEHGHHHAGADRVGHPHPHTHEHHQGHGHADHNLRSAYLHVLADAGTSVLAIVALLTGRSFGWIWMDALTGVIGAIVIGHWSMGLMRESGSVLVDAVPDPALHARIREVLETKGDRISDLHLWRLGPGHNAAVIAIVTHDPMPPEHYKALLAHVEGLSHLTIEVTACSERG